MNLKATHQLTLDDGSVLDIAPVNGGFVVVGCEVAEHGKLSQGIVEQGRAAKHTVARRAALITRHLTPELSEATTQRSIEDLSTAEMDSILEQLGQDLVKKHLEIKPVGSYKYLPLENSPFVLIYKLNGNERVVFDGMVNTVVKL